LETEAVKAEAIGVEAEAIDEIAASTSLNTTHARIKHQAPLTHHFIADLK